MIENTFLIKKTFFPLQIYLNKRFYTAQIKPKNVNSFIQTNKHEDEIQVNVNKRDKLISEPILNLNQDKGERTIDLKKDSKRKEIGFETESILDNEWKEVKVDGSKLLFDYSKLSKKNLTGKFKQKQKFYLIKKSNLKI